MPFTNPFPLPISQRKYSGDDRNFARVNGEIPSELYDLIWHLNPKPGTITIVINHLFKALTDELKRRNIKDLTNTREFQDLVVNGIFTLPGGSPVGGAVTTTTAFDDGGRAKKVRRGNKNGKGKLSGVQSSGEGETAAGE